MKYTIEVLKERVALLKKDYMWYAPRLPKNHSILKRLRKNMIQLKQSILIFDIISQANKTK